MGWGIIGTGLYHHGIHHSPAIGKQKGIPIQY
ncbi:hypothetical protein C8P63_11498 [Melghirimyces profundicolus]|uniref:Uncharacterized protein n=1 Tax=Melghirimyces profundicolus TaxID=1242148 RepID=A0A2T6BSC5_9BACL|nr:hypothetical protein C8P63_11498 [Melghirimyces profundicolus]